MRCIMGKDGVEIVLKKTMFCFLVITIFVSICHAKTKNKYGYSVSATLLNKNNIGVAVIKGELGCCIVSTEKLFDIYPVGVEKDGKNIKYFYVPYGFVVKSINNKPTEFTISNNATKNYISIDDVLLQSEAEGIFKTVFYALGGKTGRGNWSSKDQIAREEERAGKKLREAPFENWKKQPICYNLLKSRIKYWKNYNDEVKGWLTEIVKYENLSGYDDLIEYVQQM